MDKIYWLDGVGVEWLPLILERIKASRFKTDKVMIAAAKIPSITGNNRFEGEKIIKRDALDKFAHESFYKWPYSICKAIQLVYQAINEITTQTAWQRIAIVSDHGLTALSRLLDGRNYTRNAAHEGREEEVESPGTPDGDYIFTKANGKHYRVALKHVSLGAKPVHEVHGGCTPEEVLTPFIIISKRNDTMGGAPVNQPQKTATAADNKTPIAVTNKRGFAEEDLF